jgi:hypothetical protein
MFDRPNDGRSALIGPSFWNSAESKVIRAVPSSDRSVTDRLLATSLPLFRAILRPWLTVAGFRRMMVEPFGWLGISDGLSTQNGRLVQLLPRPG